MTDCTAINTAAVGDAIKITEAGATIILAGVQTQLDITAAANAGLALLPIHSVITVHSTGPQLLYTTFPKVGPTYDTGDELYTRNPNKNASTTLFTNTTTASTIADVISGLATFESTFLGHD